jgi:hypothetical protein
MERRFGPAHLLVGLSINARVVLQEIEREDEAWEQSRKPKPRHGRNIQGDERPTAVEGTETQQKRPKFNAPPGFY